MVCLEMTNVLKDNQAMQMIRKSETIEIFFSFTSSYSQTYVWTKLIKLLFHNVIIHIIKCEPASRPTCKINFCWDSSCGILYAGLFKRKAIFLEIIGFLLTYWRIQDLT